MCEWICTWAREPLEDMDMAIYKSLIKDAASLGCRKVCIGGGESSLHPEFINMLRFAKKNGLMTMVTTNLTTIKSVEAYPWVDGYQCSVDGTEETYEKIRVNAKWENTLKNLERLAKLHSNITINYVIQKLNKDEFEKIIPIAERLGIERVAYCIQFNFIQEIAQRAELTPEEKLIVLTRFKELTTTSHKVKITLERSDLRQRKIDKFPCYHQYFEAVVQPDGLVYPCCASIDMNKHLKPIGNIHEQNFSEIWENNIWDGEICKRCPIPHLNPFRLSF